MKLSKHGLRLTLAVMLAAPIVPMGVLAANRSLLTSTAGTACATTGASCMKCNPSNCELYYSQVLYYRGTYVFSRCVDWDGAPPGHCEAVTHVQYSIADVNRNGYWDEVGSCMKADCGNGTLYADRPCDNPLML